MASTPIVVNDQPLLAPANYGGAFLLCWKEGNPDDMYRVSLPDVAGAAASGTGSTLGAVSEVTATAYNIAVADADGTKRFTNPAGCTVTIPANLNVPNGTLIALDQVTAGQVILVAASGVTIQARDGCDRTRTQFSCAGIRKVANNVWTFTGDITVAV